MHGEPYNFNISTEANHAVSKEECNGMDEVPPFVGKYIKERADMDYTYHKYYSTERQLLQDELLQQFLDTIVYDSGKNMVCDRPASPWMVFTAGPMGAGKGRTMQWLARHGLFPLSAFVRVDPDSLRELLPETEVYQSIDPGSTGYLTQKEVGFMSEILTLDALNQGKNVLVDGSLRNSEWYLQYIKKLRKMYPSLRLAIINVTASHDIVLERAAKRAEVTGRIVPEEVVLETMEAIPDSLKALAPVVHFMATFDNEGEEPVMLWSSRKPAPTELGFSRYKFFDDTHQALEEESPNDAEDDLSHHRVWYTVDCDGHAITPTPSRQRALSTSKFQVPMPSRVSEPTDAWKERFANTWLQSCVTPSL